jgi:DNA-binding CsgD family transcriptional regulator
VVFETSKKGRAFYNVYREMGVGNTRLYHNTTKTDVPTLMSFSSYESTDAVLVDLLHRTQWRNGLFWPTYGYGGALGYLILLSEDDTVPAARLAETLRYFLPQVSQFNASCRRCIEEKRSPVSLSPRQAECLLMVSEGKTSKEIARSLSLAPRTVEYHIQNALQKLDVATRSQAVSKIAGANLGYGAQVQP